MIKYFFNFFIPDTLMNFQRKSSNAATGSRNPYLSVLEMGQLGGLSPKSGVNKV